MNISLQVRRLSAREVIPLRTAILRPHAPPNSHIFPGDEAPETYHAGAFLDDVLVGVASVFNEKPPFASMTPAWRLRGMGVVAYARHNGCGRSLINNCLDYVKSRKGALLWCHGRTSALPFYRSLDFQTYGEEFIVPISGPHYVMWRLVDRTELRSKT